MKKIFLSLFIITSLILFVSCKKTDNIDESFAQIVNDLSSYKLVGKLESNFPSGTKECVVTVYYKKPNMFRVELLNPNSVESQIMVKNNDGVHVIIPSINKTFKVNSSWPNNSSYPYLLHSLANDIISDDNILSTKEGNYTVLELKAKLFNKDDGNTQKITFNENNLPEEVNVYNKNKELLTKFKITSIEKNATLEDSLFNTNETLETLNTYYQDNPLTFDRTINYPTYYPEGTSLSQEVISGDASNKFAIMTFAGTKNYTITQKYLNNNEDVCVEYLNGDIYINAGSFVFVNENNITFYNEGIQYTIASNDIEVMEMIKMGDSFKSSDIK